MSLSSLRRATIERGVLGGNTAWLALGAVVWGGYALRKAMRRETGLAWRGTIDAGDTILIRAVDPKGHWHRS